MTKLRLMLVPNYAAVVDGCQVYLEVGLPLLLEPLAGNGITVVVAAPVDLANLAWSCGRPINLQQVHFQQLGKVNSRYPFMRRGISYIFQIKNILRLIKNADFCYVFFPGHTSLLSVLGCWLLGRPYGLYIRGQFIGVQEIFRKLMPWIFAKAKFLFVTGHALAHQLSKFGYRATPVVPMSPLLLRNDWNSKAKDVNQEIKLLFVGQMIREKGIFELLHAFHQLVLEGFNLFSLHMVGGGAEVDSFYTQALRMGVADRIKIYGFCADSQALEEIFRNADIFVLPTYCEGFPRVLWEAMAFRLPIVTTAVSQIPTVMRDGENVVFCKTQSSESLVEALKKLITNHALRDRLAENGYKTWLQQKEAFLADGSHGAQVVRELRRLGVIPGKESIIVTERDLTCAV